MKKRLFSAAVLFVFCALLLAADANVFDIGKVGSLPAPENLVQRFSYVYGCMVLKSILDSYPELDLEYWARGLYDALEGTQIFSDQEIQQILSDYQMKLIVARTALQRKIARENLEAANSFLEANRKNPGVLVTDCGIQYEVLRQGSGESPDGDSNVRINYECALLDGTVVDSSYARKVPSDFCLSGLISGLSKGIQLMKVGSKYKFWIPPSLAYGEDGNNVAPNSLLVFEVELLAVNH